MTDQLTGSGWPINTHLSEHFVWAQGCHAAARRGGHWYATIGIGAQTKKGLNGNTRSRCSHLSTSIPLVNWISGKTKKYTFLFSLRLIRMWVFILFSTQHQKRNIALFLDNFWSDPRKGRCRRKNGLAQRKITFSSNKRRQISNKGDDKRLHLGIKENFPLTLLIFFVHIKLHWKKYMWVPLKCPRPSPTATWTDDNDDSDEAPQRRWKHQQQQQQQRRRQKKSGREKTFIYVSARKIMNTHPKMIQLLPKNSSQFIISHSSLAIDTTPTPHFAFSHSNILKP